MSCAALVELAIPPALKYIGSRAFLDCTALRRLVKMPGTRRWRGVYAEENGFAICPAIKWPLWLHMIPDMGYTPGLGWRNILPQLSWPCCQFFRVWVRALARVRSGPAVAKQSSTRVTNHSCPPLCREVSAQLLSDREGTLRGGDVDNCKSSTCQTQ